ncbi:GNAT family N-acetyltransferase [uncultured Enterovirga sp.]|uniref:GNAT family N-acetyltransferase n=1 Tax=uncultured Enterovirga sp. TaxID=2026352 RepID=UPI0035CAE00E
MESPALPGSDGPAALLARAFMDEPLFTYLWPDAGQRRRRVPGFFDLMVSTGREHGLCETSPGREGAAIWRRPGEWQLGWGTVALNLHRFLPLFGTAVGRALRIIRLVEHRHPTKPHWYLAYLGVAPEFRGRGVARSLLRSRLDLCDLEGLPAYLETQKADNLGLYRSVGFELVGEERVPGGPPCYFMWREPRSGPEVA